MKTKTKIALKFFNVCEYEDEQKYLTQMHQNGWKLEKVSGLGVYHFERCEPENVVYQLDFNPEGQAKRDEYIKMFNDCGWKYLQDYMGYSYFRKAASETNGEEAIFCDEQSRMQLFERVARGRIVPMILIFIAILLPQLISCILHEWVVVAVIYVILIVVYLMIFGKFLFQYLNMKQKK